MEEIKDAFSRVKYDIYNLNEEIKFLKVNLEKLKQDLEDKKNIILKLSEKNYFLEDMNNQLLFQLKRMLDLYEKQTDRQTNQQTKNINSLNLSGFSLKSDVFSDKPTDKQTNINANKTDFTLNPTDNVIFKPQKAQISMISTGNQGVQTNRQTDKPTDNLFEKSSYNQKVDSFYLANETLESLDSIKKEIRLKFKRLTEQELLVFSAIYQLEEEFGYSNYKSISKKLNLTESSIRDYIRKLIIKEIPIEKQKINNKEINLSISSNFKKLLTLEAVLKLREL